MSSPRMTVSPRMVLIVAATTSRARPPENTNLIYGLWFDRLHQPATGLPCCSISDCRLTEFGSLAAAMRRLWKVNG